MTADLTQVGVGETLGDPGFEPDERVVHLVVVNGCGIHGGNLRFWDVRSTICFWWDASVGFGWMLRGGFAQISQIPRI